MAKLKLITSTFIHFVNYKRNVGYVYSKHTGL